MFTNKVVLITGSSSGIGAGAAVHFSKLGADVVITGRKADKLEKVARQCEEVGKKPLVVIGDISEDVFIEHLLSETILHNKRLDVLVNNAGDGARGTLMDTKMEDYEKVFRINVQSVFYLTKLAMPYLIQTKGNVVNVSSSTGLRALPTMLTYAMSKAALDHFSRIVSLEVADKGVRVNTINPGPIRTDIILNAGGTQEQSDQTFELMGKLTALQREGTVEETARAIAFLASDEHASYITGVNLSVDGGQQNMWINPSSLS